ncbi:MAG: indolepyruvate oxidoreductase subunit beta [Deltaproteobacteria bacterium]|nr:indolepyruvate oxidoreductase subunit beta [Deltaproteobacteria bacterium]
MNSQSAIPACPAGRRNPQSALEKMNIQMIISGVGGQGVLLVTRIISDFALREGYPLIGSEDHGMSQRGGSVITYLKIGDFNSPLVKKGSADLLLSLERSEALKTLHYLRPSSNGQNGGLGFINASDPNYMNEPIRNYLREKGIEIHIFPADRIAVEMGSVQSTNIALIGFASAHPKFPFPHDKLRQSIDRVTPPKFREVSLKIFDKGFLEGEKSIRT